LLASGTPVRTEVGDLIGCAGAGGRRPGGPANRRVVVGDGGIAGGAAGVSAGVVGLDVGEGEEADLIECLASGAIFARAGCSAGGKGFQEGLYTLQGAVNTGVAAGGIVVVGVHGGGGVDDDGDVVLRVGGATGSGCRNGGEGDGLGSLNAEDGEGLHEVGGDDDGLRDTHDVVTGRRTGAENAEIVDAGGAVEIGGDGGVRQVGVDVGAVGGGTVVAGHGFDRSYSSGGLGELKSSSQSGSVGGRLQFAIANISVTEIDSDAGGSDEETEEKRHPGEDLAILIE